MHVCYFISTHSRLDKEQQSLSKNNNNKTFKRLGLNYVRSSIISKTEIYSIKLNEMPCNQHHIRMCSKSGFLATSLTQTLKNGNTLICNKKVITATKVNIFRWRCNDKFVILFCSFLPRLTCSVITLILIWNVLRTGREFYPLSSTMRKHHSLTCWCPLLIQCGLDT